MRELILKMSVSLDGFVAGADGGVGWVFARDDAARDWTVEAIWNASLHIMGRRTFQDMRAFWPTSTEVFAPPMNQIPKAVFTRGPADSVKAPGATDALSQARAHAGAAQVAERQTGWESWDQAYVATGPLETEIAALKAADGKPIIAHGGAGFARGLIGAGLVDRYMLLVHPIALGRGLPIFSDLAEPLRLRLEEAKVFPGGAIAKVLRPA